ncbi:MAG: aminomethyl-transferring glycine dehydrogenase subunit GcvPA [Xanthomonadales bacterium]|nr:aminomethyl-transferring glycine dehydrogenase subunit GcvPA [Xanthomonadales bacterium]
MPFIPHTEQDVEQMLAEIGADSIEALFDEIPEALRISGLDHVPSGESEMAISRRMRELAARDGTPRCFAGGGAYEHHIPAAVWEITTRGEFYSAYTPYQAEASQGTLQVIYEYQTMMANLTGMDVSNASLYDGASAMAEAVLMAVRGNRKSKSSRILVPRSLNPAYRRVLDTLVSPQQIRIEEIDYAADSGCVEPETLTAYDGEDITAVIIPQPNYFGRIEDVDALTDAAHALDATVIAVINPLAAAILEPPGTWGEQGADIVCGDGQPLGVPMSSGGPYFGILCCRQALVRQMPGRLVGRTVDVDGKPGFTLTLQAREQHIRRAKATSNICTNQGLLVTAATIYMSLLGPHGLERVAGVSHSQTSKLRQKMAGIGSVELIHDGPIFHEFAVKLPRPAGQIIDRMAERNCVAGIDLSGDYPELGNAMLVCATETKTDDDLDRYVSDLRDVLS